MDEITKETNTMSGIDDVSKINLSKTPILSFVKKKITEAQIRRWGEWQTLGYIGKAKDNFQDKLNDDQIDFYNTVNLLAEEISALQEYNQSKPFLSMNKYQACVLAGIRAFQQELGIKPNLNEVKYRAVRDALKMRKQRNI